MPIPAKTPIAANAQFKGTGDGSALTPYVPENLESNSAAILEAIRLYGPVPQTITFTINSGQSLTTTYLRLLGRPGSWIINFPSMQGVTVRPLYKLADADANGKPLHDANGNIREFPMNGTEKSFSPIDTQFLPAGSLIAFQTFSDATTPVVQSANRTITIKYV